MAVKSWVYDENIKLDNGKEYTIPIDLYRGGVIKQLWEDNVVNTFQYNNQKKYWSSIISSNLIINDMIVITGSQFCPIDYLLNRPKDTKVQYIDYNGSKEIYDTLTISKGSLGNSQQYPNFRTLIEANKRALIKSPNILQYMSFNNQFKSSRLIDLGYKSSVELRPSYSLDNHTTIISRPSSIDINTSYPFFMTEISGRSSQGSISNYDQYVNLSIYPWYNCGAVYRFGEYIICIISVLPQALVGINIYKIIRDTRWNKPISYATVSFDSSTSTYTFIDTSASQNKLTWKLGEYPTTGIAGYLKFPWKDGIHYSYYRIFSDGVYRWLDDSVNPIEDLL